MIATLLLALALTVAPTTAEGQFVHDLNHARCAAGYAPLVWDGRLGVAADIKAEEMNTYDYFAHRSAMSGLWPNDLIRSVGYPLPAAFRQARNNTESLYAGGASGDVLASLLRSASHRTHLLGQGGFRNYRDIGVGFSYNEDRNVTYVVVLTAYQSGRLKARPTCHQLGY
jgi:uncharacterized protein YkwD